MLDVKVTQGQDSCWLWHKWELVEELGMSQYLVCKRCKTRRIKQYSSSYQPVNWDWVQGNTDTVNNPRKLR